MATYTPSWGVETTDSALNATAVTAGTAGDAIDATAKMMVHGTVDANPPVTPTDDLIIRIQGSLDGTNFDDTPLWEGRIDKGTDPNQVSYLLGPPLPCYFRAYCLRSGSTDTIAVTHHYRLGTFVST